MKFIEALATLATLALFRNMRKSDSKRCGEWITSLMAAGTAYHSLWMRSLSEHTCTKITKK